VVLGKIGELANRLTRMNHRDSIRTLATKAKRAARTGAGHTCTDLTLNMELHESFNLSCRTSGPPPTVRHKWGRRPCWGDHSLSD
jgi:hypothetical protein